MQAQKKVAPKKVGQNAPTEVEGESKATRPVIDAALLQKVEVEQQPKRKISGCGCW